LGPGRTLGNRWSDLSLRAKGLTVLAIPLVALLVFALLLAWFVRQNREAQGWVEYTLRARTEIRAVHRTILDAESGVRDYLLAHEESWLEPYRVAEVSLSGRLDRLGLTVADNAAQTARLARVRDLAAQRLELLRALLPLAAESTQDRRLPLLREGKSAMDALRSELEAMEGEETRLLAAHVAGRERWERRLAGTVMGGALAGLLGGLLASVLFTSSVVRRVGMLQANAERLARRAELLPPPEGQDEIGRPGQELDRAAQLVSDHASALRGAQDDLLTANRDLKRASEQALRANRLKSEFLANMSHELRTPLNSIIGFAELMRDGRVGPIAAQHKEYLGDILTSGRHLLELINDVLDLAKVEAGRLEFHPQAVAIPKLVAEVKGIVRALAARKRVVVEEELDPEVEQVVLDPGKLKQVLYNYLSNAVKFTEEGGRVVIRVKSEGEGAFAIEVEDSGIGIEAEEQGLLFSDFYQLDAGPGKRQAGTGLGLALTKKIVEAQGGRVGVRSQLGQGSCFSAVLPRRAAAAPPEPEVQVVAPGVDRGASILVVEDDARDRAWLVKVLKEAGYTVSAAATGAEAVQLSRERDFQAVTLDLLLPDMSGWEALRALREEGRSRDVATVVVSVVAEREAGAAFLIDGFLVKPASSPELLSALKAAGVPPRRDGPVLVVDDDPGALRLMELALRGLGYEPVCCSDARSGLHAAETAKPGAVILDLLMPEIDGFEFLARFRRTPGGRHTPVLVWTAKDVTGEERARLHEAAQAVVLKRDGGPDALLAELRTHLAPAPEQRA